MEFPRPNIMISACLEHSSVRFDGTMISDDVVRALKDFVNFSPVCPEVAIGMPAPRDAVRLIQRNGEEVKMVSSVKGEDFTEKMMDFTEKYIAKMKQKSYQGIILKAKSPSCGVHNVKIYQDIGKAHTISAKNEGLFGGKIRKEFSNLPLETERRLSNFNIREIFYIQIFTNARMKEVKESGKMKELVQFHAKNKYLFMTFNQNTLRQLGNIVANRGKLPLEEVMDLYEESLLQLFASEPTKRKRINVLTHIYGYFKNKLNKEEIEYYFDTQRDYENNHIPYSSVLSVLKSYAVRFNETYLLQQTIFEPYPKQLLLQLDSGKTL